MKMISEAVKLMKPFGELNRSVRPVLYWVFFGGWVDWEFRKRSESCVWRANWGAVRTAG
jgi:hypothetical protein